MYSLIYTALLGLLVTASAAPVAQSSGIVILAEYSTYSTTHCTSLISNLNIGPDECNGLPDAESVNATFSDARGRELRLYYDSNCQEFAQVLPLDTCTNTADYYSISLYCTGGIECPAV